MRLLIPSWDNPNKGRNAIVIRHASLGSPTAQYGRVSQAS